MPRANLCLKDVIEFSWEILDNGCCDRRNGFDRNVDTKEFCGSYRPGINIISGNIEAMENTEWGSRTLLKFRSKVAFVDDRKTIDGLRIGAIGNISWCKWVVVDG